MTNEQHLIFIYIDYIRSHETYMVPRNLLPILCLKNNGKWINNNNNRYLLQKHLFPTRPKKIQDITLYYIIFLFLLSGWFQID